MVVDNIYIKPFIQVFHKGIYSSNTLYIGNITESTDGEKIRVSQIIGIKWAGENLIVEGLGMTVIE